ncbi:MAG TPA: hypothetical protein VF092_07690 [Longimicrobium sp.]
MFDPIEFAFLARQLAAGDLIVCGDPAASREAQLRAAFGRAYYAVFLVVRFVLLRRHHIRSQWVDHGNLYNYLQHSRAGEHLNHLGREIERLYRLRQKADYELGPTADWQRRLTNPVLADFLARQAIELTSAVEDLDFSPVVHLFRR